MKKRADSKGWVACWVDVGDGVKVLRKIRESTLYDGSTVITSMRVELAGEEIEVLLDHPVDGLEPLGFVDD